MRRDIKFRGWYAGSNPHWIVGSFAIKKSDMGKEDYRIYHSGLQMWYCVEPNTVGEFTGLTDKCEDDIYEGDILEKDGDTFVVDFHNGAFTTTDTEGTWHELLAELDTSEWEIIGNIHKKPLILVIRSPKE